MEPVRVLVVEDDADQRRYFQTIIDGTPGLACVAVAASAENALRQVSATRSEVVLLDLQLPGESGVDCIPKLRCRQPPIEVLVLTLHDEPEWLYPALAAGATGYLVKPVTPAELTQAIFAIRSGGSPMSGAIARMVLDTFRRKRCQAEEMETLTERETEVLPLLAAGDRQKEIAAKLAISIRTVGAHLHKIYEKLHVHNATAAASKFLAGRG